jgi:hypothetical protein
LNEIIKQVKGKIPSCSDLLEFAVREGIENIQFSQGKQKINPSVILNIEKINSII